MLHGRLSAPLVPFVLLLLGVPVLVGFESSVSNRMIGVVLCIVVAATFHTATFVCLSFANTGAMDPVLAAWAPVLGGGLTGAWLMGTMRT